MILCEFCAYPVHHPERVVTTYEATVTVRTAVDRFPPPRVWPSADRRAATDPPRYPTAREDRTMRPVLGGSAGQSLGRLSGVIPDFTAGAETATWGNVPGSQDQVPVFTTVEAGTANPRRHSLRTPPPTARLCRSATRVCTWTRRTATRCRSTPTGCHPDRVAEPVEPRLRVLVGPSDGLRDTDDLPGGVAPVRAHSSSSAAATRRSRRG